MNINKQMNIVKIILKLSSWTIIVMNVFILLFHMINIKNNYMNYETFITFLTPDR